MAEKPQTWMIWIWSGCGHRQWGLYEGAEGECPECGQYGKSVEVEVEPVRDHGSDGQALGTRVDEVRRDLEAAREAMMKARGMIGAIPRTPLPPEHREELMEAMEVLFVAARDHGGDDG